jgi:hypothetical protein
MLLEPRWLTVAKNYSRSSRLMIRQGNQPRGVPQAAGRCLPGPLQGVRTWCSTSAPARLAACPSRISPARACSSASAGVVMESAFLR